MECLLSILEHNFLIATIALCFIVAMVLKAVTRVVTAAARERSRREIAAYIAEGSISPDQGERLMRADVDGHRSEV
jgi:hypothetical protein